MSHSQQQERRDQHDGSDARDGASHPRAAAGPPAAPKLDRRTFLGDLTQSHITPLPESNVWSIKIHDFGKPWVEMSWGKVEACPGKKGEKGRSRNREHNEARARSRAKGEIRRKCLTIGADHLVTLTYRANVDNRERVLHDLERLRRALSRAGCSMAYGGGTRTSTAWGIASAYRRERLSGCSAVVTVLVQDRGAGTRAGQRQRTTARQFTGQVGSLSLKIPQQGSGPPPP